MSGWVGSVGLITRLKCKHIKAVQCYSESSSNDWLLTRALYSTHEYNLKLVSNFDPIFRSFILNILGFFAFNSKFKAFFVNNLFVWNSKQTNFFLKIWLKLKIKQK